MRYKLKKNQHLLVLLISPLFLCACDSTENLNDSSIDDVSAAVTDVSFTGAPGNYTLSVTIESPDTGCSQYADWWEVFRPDGSLVYRRILAHSHVDEQPFTRSGGPVNIAADENIIVRAHMNNNGYGDQVYTGSISQGLTPDTLDSLFAAELAASDPLPVDCAF